MLLMGIAFDKSKEIFVLTVMISYLIELIEYVLPLFHGHSRRAMVLAVARKRYGWLLWAYEFTTAHLL